MKFIIEDTPNDLRTEDGGQAQILTLANQDPFIIIKEGDGLFIRIQSWREGWKKEKGNHPEIADMLKAKRVRVTIETIN